MKKRTRQGLGSPLVKKQIKPLSLLAAAGLCAGLLCGLLGAGGGILLLFAFRKTEAKDSLRDAFATALAVMIPLSVLACARYAAYGSLSADQLAPFLLPAIGGGLCGGWLLGKIHLFWLRLLFAALMVVSGVLLLFR